MTNGRKKKIKMPYKYERNVANCENNRVSHWLYKIYPLSINIYLTLKKL